VNCNRQKNKTEIILRTEIYLGSSPTCQLRKLAHSSSVVGYIGPYRRQFRQISCNRFKWLRNNSIIDFFVKFTALPRECKRVTSLYHAALFTHCFCHNANRAAINAVYNNTDQRGDDRCARNLFGTVELLYSFIQKAVTYTTHSSAMWRQLAISRTRRHLKVLPDTRWDCRFTVYLQRLQVYVST